MSDEHKQELEQLKKELELVSTERDQYKEALDECLTQNTWFGRVGLRVLKKNPYRAIVEAQVKAASLLGRLSILIAASPGVVNSIQEWREAWDEKRVSTEETANVVAAIIKRATGQNLLLGLILSFPALVAALGTMVTALGTIYLLWHQTTIFEQQTTIFEQQTTLFQQQTTAIDNQTTLIRDQNKLIIEQNQLVQEQIQQQQQISNITRRTELIAILYDRRDCRPVKIEECLHKASVRARAEAAKGFVDIARILEARPDLRKVVLNGADLTDASLEETLGYLK
ncbi:MAG: hypothetical protein AAF702_01420 [Chloroflexota bacterium]